MKVLVALSVLALVAFSASKPKSRGCIYVGGKCQRECEVGTHSYNTACSPMTPEPTCDVPNPEPGKAAVCDYSACYCDSPTLRDSVSGKCVQPKECPKKEKDTPKEEKDAPKKE